MKGLRIELAGELLDLSLVDEKGSADEALPHPKVIEIKRIVAVYLIAMTRPPANRHSTNDLPLAHDSRTDMAHAWTFVYGATIVHAKTKSGTAPSGAVRRD